LILGSSEDREIMNKKLKRIIARETVILSAVLIVALLGYLLTSIDSCYGRGKVSSVLGDVSLSCSIYLFIFGLAVILLFYVYPSYLIIRFIIWAVRKLRKSNK
jgi:low temperature requirement protein LtrA